MDGSLFGKREKVKIKLQGLAQDIGAARNKLRTQDYLAALDIYEQLSEAYPLQAIDILAEVYDVRQTLPSQDRYTLYQARCCNFGIKPGDKVLDIGSGHSPFPYATHLSDISTTDDYYGRGGTPFKHTDGKPVYEFNVENIPFANNEFDFVYCSHVLEHCDNPERACQELMRVGKRGFIETPTKAKDLWLNCAKVSNHKWAVEIENNVLVFHEYQQEEIEGLGSDVLMHMISSPQTKREKAFSALVILKPEFMNTMLLWEGNFKYEVKRKQDRFVNMAQTLNSRKVNSQNRKVVSVGRGINDSCQQNNAAVLTCQEPVNNLQGSVGSSRKITSIGSIDMNSTVQNPAATMASSKIGLYDPEPKEVVQAKTVLRSYYEKRMNDIWMINDSPVWYDHEIDAGLWPDNLYWLERGVFGRAVMPPGCRVLDICCGDGYYSDIWYSSIAGHIDACDNDRDAIMFASQRHANPKVSYHSVDILNKPFPSSRYNVVTWFEAIEHFSEEQIVFILKKIESYLERGGMLIGSTPMFEPRPEGTISNANHQHDREFTSPDDLKSVLKRVFVNAQTWISTHPNRTVCFFKAAK